MYKIIKTTIEEFEYIRMSEFEEYASRFNLKMQYLTIFFSSINIVLYSNLILNASLSNWKISAIVFCFGCLVSIMFLFLLSIFAASKIFEEVKENHDNL